jgi:hypothetical protein
LKLVSSLRWNIQDGFEHDNIEGPEPDNATA